MAWFGGLWIYVKEPNLGPMNKGISSHKQEGDEFIKSKVPLEQAKEAVENVGLKPRVEGQALRRGR